MSRPGWVRTILGSWIVNGVLLGKSGIPFTVVSGSDGPEFGNVDGQGSDRVSLLQPERIGTTIGHPDTSAALLPREAFGFIAPADRGGNLGRNTFLKGRIANLDLSIARTWSIAPEHRLTFRAESINLLNTAQLAEPNRWLTSPSFGRITNTLNDGHGGVRAVSAIKETALPVTTASSALAELRSRPTNTVKLL